MLTQAHRQEALSRAYVQAIAGKCGLLTSSRDFDYGIDMTLHLIRRLGRRYFESGHTLDIQARSCIAAQRTETDVLYDLAVRTYDLLREIPPGAPRILVVLALPELEDHWLACTEDNLVLRYCAYWISLRGAPPSSNRTTIRIEIPRRNQFSISGLNAIMTKVQQQEPL